MKESYELYIGANSLANAVAAMKLLDFNPKIQEAKLMYCDRNGGLHSDKSLFYGDYTCCNYIVFHLDEFPDKKIHNVLLAFGHIWKKQFKETALHS